MADKAAPDLLTSAISSVNLQVFSLSSFSSFFSHLVFIIFHLYISSRCSGYCFLLSEREGKEKVWERERERDGTTERNTVKKEKRRQNKERKKEREREIIEQLAQHNQLTRSFGI